MSQESGTRRNSLVENFVSCRVFILTQDMPRESSASLYCDIIAARCAVSNWAHSFCVVVRGLSHPDMTVSGATAQQTSPPQRRAKSPPLPTLLLILACQDSNKPGLQVPGSGNSRTKKQEAVVDRRQLRMLYNLGELRVR